MLSNVAGSNIVVSVGLDALSFRGMLTLNEVGTFIWKALENDNTPENIAKAIVGEYKVDYDTALADVNSFISRLRDKGFIEE
jgi:hypothetical protein